MRPFGKARFLEMQATPAALALLTIVIYLPLQTYKIIHAMSWVRDKMIAKQRSGTTLYLCTHSETGKSAVEKVTPIGPNAHVRPSLSDHTQEARIMEMIRDTSSDHPGKDLIISLQDVQVTDEEHVIRMDTAAGVDLYQFLSHHYRSSEWTAKRMWKVFRDIVRAVHFLHQHKIAHMDLSIQNIMIDPQTDEIKLIDLGMSVHVADGDSSQVFNSFYLGNYGRSDGVCPEGKPKKFKRYYCWDRFRNDAHALGIILFEMATQASPNFANNPPEWETLFRDGIGMKEVVSSKGLDDFDLEYILYDYGDKVVSLAYTICKGMLDGNMTMKVISGLVCNNPSKRTTVDALLAVLDDR